ncbi:signal-transducing adaptor protein 2a [Brienomyrus brachyistius]|uniref:signal-transducing adaptor protein 2a n=1 Tax=Brienomyrus brachyistius TaxID=42636 RepID=UPI0020B43609|nr:signal-transducing adaptor protein 2a [Brienomyrus brachyistius]XP_048844898.1 signal-transducing adaptor protein 2a [Brienomyrus brachyistius]
MASTPSKQRAGRTRAQLPACYYEGYLEKRAHKEKVSQRLWTCLCGNALYFFNSTKDSAYAEKLDLSGFISLTDDDSRGRNLEAARLTLRLRSGEVTLTAPSLEARELWKGFIYSVVELSVPSSLNLLPGQLYMLKEVVERERERRRRKPPPTHPAPAVPLYLPLVGEIPACFQAVSRTEAEVLLERHPDCGNLLLRPGRDGSSLAVTTRQDLHGSVFRHYRVTQKQDGGYLIEVENPIPCATLHDVIDRLVEKTAGTLQPFLLEEPYEGNITFVKSNDENGERSLHQTFQSPQHCTVPALPPKPGSLHDHWFHLVPTEEHEENVYLNEPCGLRRASSVPPPSGLEPPALPPKPGRKGFPRRNNSSPGPPKERFCSEAGVDKRALKPLPPPPDSEAPDASEADGQLRQMSLVPDSVAQAVTEELKLKLELRRTNQ